MTERPEIAALDRPVNDLVALNPGDELRPPWLTGAARLPVTDVASDLPGRPLAHFVIGGERLPAITRDGDRIRWGFDPAATWERLASEAYLPAAGRPAISRLPAFYRVVPGTWRLRLHGWLTRRHAEEAEGAEGAEGAGFPAWPIETAGALIAEIMRRCLGRPRPTWPRGARYAVAICHDVDTRGGLRSVPAIRQVDESAGLQSGWAVVAACYNGFEALLDDLRAAGHEILCHGLRHDFRLPFLDPAEIARRLDRCRPMIERFSVKGFRSPAMLTSPALRRAVGERFSYDSSVPDTAVRTPIGPRRGCAMVEPFSIEGVLEVPLTVPLEDKLLLMGYDARGILDLWRRKVAWLKSVGGLAMITTHCQRHLGARRDILGIYGELVRRLAEDGDAWIATPGEVARHWRTEMDGAGA